MLPLQEENPSLRPRTHRKWLYIVVYYCNSSTEKESIPAAFRPATQPNQQASALQVCRRSCFKTQGKQYLMTVLWAALISHLLFIFLMIQTKINRIVKSNKVKQTCNQFVGLQAVGPCFFLVL